MPLHPPPLSAGSHVRVLSPSGPVTPEILASGLQVLRDWNLEVTVDPRAYAREGYLAGGDVDRAEALNAALRDEDVDAIIFSRGGYGAMRLLDRIDWGALARKPRPIVGFSDITAIHLAAFCRADVATLHGPVVKSFAQQHVDIPALHAALFGKPRDLNFDLIGLHPGVARGPLVGGNLSLVAAMLASTYLPCLDGAILVLEDVTEEDYRLDRLFTALRLSAQARTLGGIVLGDFDRCGGVYVCDEDIPGFVAELALEMAREFDIPVAAGFPSGHGARNVAFPHGVHAELNGSDGTLRFLADLCQ